ncbi:hypothetical protein GYMLUDRAFT_244826 [Collybiopsis luxurians FD-317 M1]|uniref:Uncharacterized protein n=1 Tax=Collybiopsis luxurians FD-317 M1 TaxID=944289 RepID=A0A0D0CC32_9AGAR|nr:hypothetical protein GYMLUDRAFT_244826 [Collybiopsis luxurians FD-317 M1]
MRRFRIWLILLALSSVFYFVKGGDNVSHPAASKSTVDQDLITPRNLERWYALMKQKFTQQVSLPPENYTDYAFNEGLKSYPEIETVPGTAKGNDERNEDYRRIVGQEKRRKLNVDDANVIPSTSTSMEIVLNMKWP